VIPERPVGQAERPGALLRRQQLLAGDVHGGHGRKHDVAALGVEAAGQGVDERDGPEDLGGIALLFDAAPGVIRDGPRFPEQPCGLLDLVAPDPADRRDRLGRVATTDLGG